MEQVAEFNGVGGAMLKKDGAATVWILYAL